MKTYYKILPLVLLVFCLACASKENKAKQEVWQKIASSFIPPSKFKNNYGEYKSPLVFNNGDTVKSANDWSKRREEIKDKWTERLGEWPAIIEDNELEILETKQREGLTQHRVKFRWTPDQYTEGYLLAPAGSEKKAAVIIVFYEPETAIGEGTIPYRDFAVQLAKRGFVTLSIGTKEASNNKVYSLFYPSMDSLTVAPLSMLSYAAANAWQVVSKLDYVDSERIGIAGHSFGGKWAMFASCLYDKFACAAWSDSGIVFDESRASVNYWEPYYLGFHPQPWRKRGMITPENPAQGLYTKLMAEKSDLHELHALMVPRPFLVSGGAEDPDERWIPLNHTIAINKVLGYENRVAMTNRPDHAPNEESNEQMYLFFDYFLK